MSKNKGDNLLNSLILGVLLVVGFFYRIYGLNANYSFWTDENHVAIFARAILERGKSVLVNGYSTGVYQWLQYWLSAISAKIFGLNELGIRFPSVVFGVLTVWTAYLLGKELFNKNVGLVAAIFATFLKIEILWSRQARPYQALQFFYLLGAWFIYKLTKQEKFKWRYFLGFLASGVLASLMHGLGLVIFGVGFLYLLRLRFSWLKKWVLPAGLLALVFGDVFGVQILAVFSQIGKINNLFYYRVFLWHDYSLLVFLALAGFLSLVFQKKNSWQIPFLFLAIQGVIASFLLSQPFTRYFYVVFPFLILFSAVGIEKIAQVISPQTSNLKPLTLMILTLFIIAMGHKFTLLPKRAYSLNEDMQEIPEVNWERVYEFVGEKLNQNEDIILVANWNDLPVWYLGEGKLDYLLRKPGQIKIEKDRFSSAFMLYSLEELKKIIEENKRGILIIDSWDDRIPEGIREYCRDNLEKQLGVDRLYTIQPRYWPVEVYSWGM